MKKFKRRKKVECVCTICNEKFIGHKAKFCDACTKIKRVKTQKNQRDRRLAKMKSDDADYISNGTIYQFTLPLPTRYEKRFN